MEDDEAKNVSTEGLELKKKSKILNDEIELAMNNLQFSRALEAIWEYIRLINKYVEVSQPWVLVKNPAAKDSLNEVLYNLIEALRLISLFIFPFMPNTAAEIQKQLGLTENNKSICEKIKWGGMKPGTNVCKGKPIFPKVGFSVIT